VTRSQEHKKLEQTAQYLGEIRYIQRPQPGRRIVAVAAVVEPVVAIFDRVQRRVWSSVSLAALRESVERIVQQAQPAVQVFNWQTACVGKVSGKRGRKRLPQ